MYTVELPLIFVQGTIPPEQPGEEPSQKYIRTDFVLYDKTWVYNNTVNFKKGDKNAACDLYEYYDSNPLRTLVSSGMPMSYIPFYDAENHVQSDRFRCRLSRGTSDFHPEDLTVNEMTTVYASKWKIQNGRFAHDELAPCDTTPYFQPPYPPNFWFIDEDKITHSQIPETIYQGAFCDCVNLKKVIIPPSVKYIGEYAFYNTALTAVTIARDCTFFPTSFPPRCTINYYLE